MSDEFDSLVRNALDFLTKSIAELEQGSVKYSVIDFYSGLELFLKAKLLKEHWALCARKVGQEGLELLARGEFESIGLEEAKIRLANILKSPVSKPESDVYDRLRKRRNQAVHFFHPEDLRSTPKVAVEQLLGWYYLHRRLTITWKEDFQNFTCDLERLHGSVSKRVEYFPSVYQAIQSEMAKKAKHTLLAGCEFCHQPSAFASDRLFWDVYRVSCEVCGFEVQRAFLPCVVCGKLAPRSFEESLVCQWCGTAQAVDISEVESWANIHEPNLDRSAWCSVCGYLPRPMVARAGHHSICLACLFVEEISTIGGCDWCGDVVTGSKGNLRDPGCYRCGIHISEEAGAQQEADDNYYNTVEERVVSRNQHREWQSYGGW